MVGWVEEWLDGWRGGWMGEGWLDGWGSGWNNWKGWEWMELGEHAPLRVLTNPTITKCKCACCCEVSMLMQDHYCYYCGEVWIII